MVKTMTNCEKTLNELHLPPYPRVQHDDDDGMLENLLEKIV